jgi:hypothetical protein
LKNADIVTIINSRFDSSLFRTACINAHLTVVP